MKSVLRSTMMGLLGVAALVMTAGSPAQAAFVVGGENGWQMTYDGMINVFMVYTTKSNQAADDQSQSFRIRTGLLPSIFAFNVKSPTMNGVDYAARIGLYPQVQNSGTHTGLGPGTGGDLGNGGTSIDVREVFFTADGKFGQFLVGRALNLYQGKNILTDMTLIGNGVPLNMTGGGVDLGHIGYGYTYAAFGPQFRYTTPDMSGFKVAFAICDPSRLNGTNVAGTVTTSATVINQPRFETELSYVRKIGEVNLNTWLGGIYQQASFNGRSKKVNTLGGAMGVQATMGPFEALLSGWGGEGIGMGLTQDDTEALDAFGEERVAFGGLAHATYQLGKAKLGLQYGINYQYETENDNRITDLVTKSKQALTAGVYYSVNKYLTLVGEYTRAENRYYNGFKETMNVFSAGTVFTW